MRFYTKPVADGTLGCRQLWLPSIHSVLQTAGGPVVTHVRWFSLRLNLRPAADVAKSNCLTVSFGQNNR